LTEQGVTGEARQRLKAWLFPTGTEEALERAIHAAGESPGQTPAPRPGDLIAWGSGRQSAKGVVLATTPAGEPAILCTGVDQIEVREGVVPLTALTTVWTP